LHSEAVFNSTAETLTLVSFFVTGPVIDEIESAWHFTDAEFCGPQALACHSSTNTIGAPRPSSSSTWLCTMKRPPICSPLP
jgi:hypothetical protein